MTLLEELQEQGIILEAVGDRLKFRGPAEVLTPTLRQRIAEHKAEILAFLRRQQAADTLEKRIRFARSEVELEATLEQIQPALDAGHMSQAQGARLTWLAVEVARQLDAGLVNLPASAFLEAI